MESTGDNALNCSNCGGQLDYNYTRETSKCIYCGTEFKKEHSQKEQSYDEPYARVTFVETSVKIPKKNKAIFNNTPKPDIKKLRKAFFWGLGAWTSWLIVSPLIAGITMSISGKLVASNNLFQVCLSGYTGV